MYTRSSFQSFRSLWDPVSSSALRKAFLPNTISYTNICQERIFRPVPCSIKEHRIAKTPFDKYTPASDFNAKEREAGRYPDGSVWEFGAAEHYRNTTFPPPDVNQPALFVSHSTFDEKNKLTHAPSNNVNGVSTSTNFIGHFRGVLFCLPPGGKLHPDLAVIQDVPPGIDQPFTYYGNYHRMISPTRNVTDESFLSILQDETYASQWERVWRIPQNFGDIAIDPAFRHRYSDDCLDLVPAFRIDGRFAEYFEEICKTDLSIADAILRKHRSEIEKLCKNPNSPGLKEIVEQLDRTLEKYDENGDDEDGDGNNGGARCLTMPTRAVALAPGPIKSGDLIHKIVSPSALDVPEDRILEFPDPSASHYIPISLPPLPGFWYGQLVCMFRILEKDLLRAEDNGEVVRLGIQLSQLYAFLTHICSRTYFNLVVSGGNTNGFRGRTRVGVGVGRAFSSVPDNPARLWQFLASHPKAMEIADVHLGDVPPPIVDILRECCERMVDVLEDCRAYQEYLDTHDELRSDPDFDFDDEWDRCVEFENQLNKEYDEAYRMYGILSASLKNE